MEHIEIAESKKRLTIKNASIDGATFNCVSLAGSTFTDVNMSNIKITDANITGLEIEGAQLGGAYIHNIGMPPEGHPMYDPNVKQRPLKFEDCNFGGTTITDCNLTGVEIANCNLTGMKINGILVEDLLSEYAKQAK